MEALILLAVLACPVVMGTMMLLMWRGARSHTSGSRAEHDVGPPEESAARKHREVAGR
jgi:hypothetical protein